MLSQSFNAGWNIKVGFNQPFSNLFSTELDLGTPVTLPHDAMILEQKTPDTKNEFIPVGWYKSMVILPEAIIPGIPSLQFRLTASLSPAMRIKSKWLQTTAVKAIPDGIPAAAFTEM